MKCFLTILILFILSSATGQNLVNNPSFEDTVHCPTNISQLNKCKYWLNPTAASPDYDNTCDTTVYAANVPYTAFGFQYARTGNAFAGFYTGGPCLSPPNIREYVQTMLLSPMVSGKEYYVSFYVTLSNWANYATSKIGAYISVTAPTRTDMNPINYTPQIQNANGFITDTLNWTKISGFYFSSGGEQYLTIGNFYNESATDTLNRGLGIYGFRCHYYYIDDVSVIDSASTGIENISTIKTSLVYPNPTSDHFYINTNTSDKLKVDLLDINGRHIFSKTVNDKSIINVADLNEGVYTLAIQVNGYVTNKKLVIIR